MAEKLKAIGMKLEKAAAGTLLLLCVCIFFGLTYYSVRYTVTEDTGAGICGRPGGVFRLVSHI